MIDHVVTAAPALVLDVATGPAGVALDLARRLPGRVVGVDLSAAMLAQGRRNVAQAGLDGRIALLLGQGERLPFPDASFDALTFTYLLRYVADPAATLVELARVVLVVRRPAASSPYLPTVAGAGAGGSTRVWCSPSVVRSLEVARGTPSGASWGRTSTTTTGGSPWPPRSLHGKRPASPTSGCAA